jgi:hypothetical protein
MIVEHEHLKYSISDSVITTECVAVVGGSSDEEQIKSKYRNIREIWNKLLAQVGWTKLGDGSLVNDREVCIVTFFHIRRQKACFPFQLPRITDTQSWSD